MRLTLEMYSSRAARSARSPFLTAQASAPGGPRKAPTCSAGSFRRSVMAFSMPRTIAVTGPAFRAAGSPPLGIESSTFPGGTPAAATAFARLVPFTVPTFSRRSSSTLATTRWGLRVTTTARVGKTSAVKSTRRRRASVT